MFHLLYTEFHKMNDPWLVFSFLDPETKVLGSSIQSEIPVQFARNQRRICNSRFDLSVIRISNMVTHLVSHEAFFNIPFKFSKKMVRYVRFAVDNIEKPLRVTGRVLPYWFSLLTSSIHCFGLTLWVQGSRPHIRTL